MKILCHLYTPFLMVNGAFSCEPHNKPIICTIIADLPGNSNRYSKKFYSDPNCSAEGFCLFRACIVAKTDADCSGFQGSCALMSQRSTVQPCPDSDPSPSQFLCKDLAVLRRQKGYRSTLRGSAEYPVSPLFQSPGAPLGFPLLPGKDIFDTKSAHGSDPRCQAGNAGDIQSSCFRPFRQLSRHFLLTGHRSGAAVK